MNANTVTWICVGLLLFTAACITVSIARAWRRESRLQEITDDIRLEDSLWRTDRSEEDW